MKFCSDCGAEVEFRVPEDDNRHRHVCIRCKTVYYNNPKIVAGCIPEWDGRVLLCKRAIEPRYGLWTLPAGYMETGESTLQAAARETMEEANASVEIQDLYMVINLPYVNQVYMMYRSRLREEKFSSGLESLAVSLYGENDLPWHQLAFPAIRETLQFYFKDLGSGNFRIRTGEINREAGSYSFQLHT